MSLSIYISNQVPELASAMIADLDKHKGQVFNPHFVVTQTQGMNNWLTFQIADQLGIAANIEFLKPSDIVWKTYDILGGIYSDKISRQHLDWLIYSIIGGLPFQKDHKRQAAYFIENGVRDEMKQWEFAAKIADLFDQYQIYRSPVIQQWNTADIGSIDSDIRWQAFIWKALKQKTGNAVMDITEVQTAILAHLKDEERRQQLQKKMPRLYLFGLSIVTPFHLQIFYALSEYIDIKWYMSNPAPEHFWFEDQNEQQVFLRKIQGKHIAHISIGNSLLTSWGKVLQNTFRMMFQTDEFINAVLDLPVLPPKNDTLLSAVQNELFENNIEKPSFNRSWLRDDSITITSNYSMRREVETLYNYILNTVSHQPFGTISERDIIVMVSDINAYAPFIRAVMDNAPYQFQYSIADESIATGDTIVTGLIALLEINGTIFSAESVLQLLDHERIRTKFGIYDPELLRSVVKQANIRFGTENDYNTEQDDTYLVSWKYGLQKIMYGSCMAGETLLGTDKKFYTIESTDNVADLQQIVAFSALVKALTDSVKERRTAKTLGGWKTYIEDLLNDFLLSDDQDKDEYYAEIVQKFKQNEVIDQYLDNETISYDIFSRKLITGLGDEVFQARFLSRGITFCSPLPFRSIPFKVVAILGLNYNSFPRKAQHVDFDIMARSPQLGDRNIKNNDKHLFLESLLAAEHALYLSYIGRSTKDNKTRPPSVLLDELLDYIQSGYTGEDIDVRKILIQEHPLQSYSVRYDQKEHSALLPNYLIRDSAPWPLKERTEKEISAEPVEYSIDKLWQFFNRAIKYYYNEVLQVYFEQDEIEIASTEHFVLDHLQHWTLKQSISEALLQENLENTQQHLYLNAKVPLKNVGKSVLQNATETLTPMIKWLREDLGSSTAPERLPLYYDHKGKLFQGQLNDIYDNKLIAFHVSKNDKLYKTQARMALQYLFAKAQYENIDNVIIYSSHGKMVSKKITKEQAREHLQTILDTFLQIRESPVMYSVATRSSKMTEETFLKELKRSLTHEAGYSEYVAHALNTLNLEHQQVYFAKMDLIINQIFLALYEQ